MQVSSRLVPPELAVEQDRPDADPAAFAYHLLYTHHYLPRRPEARNPVSVIENLIEKAAGRGYIHLDAAPALMGARALGPVLQTALHGVYGRLAGPMKSHAPALSKAVCAIFGLPPVQRPVQRSEQRPVQRPEQRPVKRTEQS